MAAGAGALLFSAAFLGTKLVYLGVVLYLAAAVCWFAVRLFQTRRAATGRCLAAALLLCAVLCALYPVSPLSRYVEDIYVHVWGGSGGISGSLTIPGVVERDRFRPMRGSNRPQRHLAGRFD